MPRKRKSTDSYHHGDLRRALLEGALKIIERHGLEQLSLRELARRLGVSPAAPYHHFANRSALVFELAQQGFAKLLEFMTREIADEKTPRERLVAIGRGYLRFAIAHPSYYRLMFLVDHHGPSDRLVSHDKDYGEGFDLLRQCVIACASPGNGTVDDPMPAILAMWGGVHGIASLWLEGPLKRMQAPEEYERLSIAALHVLVNALAPGISGR